MRQRDPEDQRLLVALLTIMLAFFMFGVSIYVLSKAGVN